MLKAVLRNGSIVPMGPLPLEWEEGTTLEVGRADSAAMDMDQWLKLMDQLCADSAAEDEARMQAAIDEHRRQAKTQSRIEMGLSK